MKKYQLIKKILEKSVSDTWHEAQKEWSVIEIYPNDYDERCLCGHYPIKEICVIQNKYNHKKEIVGNVCVTKFIDPEMNRKLQSVKRIVKDIGKSLNKEAINFYYEKGLFSHKNRDFYLNIMRKKKLTPKAAKYKHDLNRRVMADWNRRRQPVYRYSVNAVGENPGNEK